MSINPDETSLEKSRRHNAREEDDDDRPRKKSSRDEDTDDEDRARKKTSRDVDAEDDEDRPPKKKVRDDDDDIATKTPKPMPLRLVGAIIAAMAWGILGLNGSCVNSSNLSLGLIQHHKVLREMEDQRRKQDDERRRQIEDMRARGINVPDFGGDMGGRIEGGGQGTTYTFLGTQLFMMMMSTVLIGAGIILLMRKGFGKYLAMGAPVGIIVGELLGFVICLIISKGTMLVQYNVAYLVNSFFSVVVGGIIIFLLLNKDVSKALK